MELTYFCDKIGLPGEAVRRIAALPAGEKTYREAAPLFRADRERFFARMLQAERPEQYFLYVYCRMAMDVLPEYEKRKIPESVFWDTFRDLAIWCADCFEKTGTYGIRQYEWFVRHMDLTLFRLGRLEFERMPSVWDVRQEPDVLTKGEPLISVHVPAGEPLGEDACRQSVRRAFDFFGRDLPYVCHSWLLGPELPGLLEASSNILRFRELFRVIAVDYLEREAEERIFLRTGPDPRNYPERTGLQRAARAHLIAGGRLGNGLGLLRKTLFVSAEGQARPASPSG